MPTPRAHHRRRRAGFSLVLALVVTALLVLAILTATAFLKVESALATTKQTESRARLNALAAVRLAGAALQERLGPDTRVSAPATIYDDPAASSATFPGSDPFEYPILGVWRSWEGGDHDTRPGSRYAGRPHRPDYAAKRSAFDPTAAISGRFLGWLLSDQMGYGGAGNAGPAATGTKPAEPPLVFATKSTVPLVGPATDAQAVRQVHVSPISFVDGQPAARTTDGSRGTFGWWVGGENQKVRLLGATADVAPLSVLEKAQHLGSFGSPDLEAIGYVATAAAITASSQEQAISAPSLQLLPSPTDTSRLTLVLKQATPRPLAKAGFHDVSVHAEGLLTNTATGGLRKDLSLFTETWDWANALDPARQGKMPLFRLKPAKLPRDGGDPDYDLAFRRPLPDALMPAGIGNRRRHALMYWWADYGSLGGTWAGLAADGGTNFGGYGGLSSFPPIRSWAYLVDYCLHYRKYVANPDPALGGVTAMLPPQPVNVPGGGDLYSYYERVHRHPLIARIQYVFASAAVGDSPAFLAQPVVTLWNPFNVQLTVPGFLIYCKWDSLPVQINCNDGVLLNVTQRVGDYFTRGVNLWVGGGSAITLAPGQTRLFALNDGINTSVPLGNVSGTYNLTPGYVASGRSGWRMILPGTANAGGRLRYRLLKNIDDYWVARDGIFYDYYPAHYKYSPVRFSFVGATTAQFRQLYGEDAPFPFQQTLADAAASPRAFGTFAFGLRLSNDGVVQHDGRTGVKTLSKGFLQASPFTTYTELGQKSAEVLTAYPYASANVTDRSTVPVGDQIGAGNRASFYSAGNSGVQYPGALNPVNAPYDLYFLPMSGFVDSNGPQSDPTNDHGGFILTGLDPTTADAIPAGPAGLRPPRDQSRAAVPLWADRQRRRLPDSAARRPRRSLDRPDGDAPQSRRDPPGLPAVRRQLLPEPCAVRRLVRLLPGPAARRLGRATPGRRRGAHLESGGDEQFETALGHLRGGGGDPAEHVLLAERRRLDARFGSGRPRGFRRQPRATRRLPARRRRAARPRPVQRQQHLGHRLAGRARQPAHRRGAVHPARRQRRHHHPNRQSVGSHGSGARGAGHGRRRLRRHPRLRRVERCATRTTSGRDRPAGEGPWPVPLALRVRQPAASTGGTGEPPGPFTARRVGQRPEGARTSGRVSASGGTRAKDREDDEQGRRPGRAGANPAAGRLDRHGGRTEGRLPPPQGGGRLLDVRAARVAASGRPAWPARADHQRPRRDFCRPGHGQRPGR